ncbi:hypothetical protein BaRGS_00028927, partial [Batillaria attramentaria]
IAGGGVGMWEREYDLGTGRGDADESISTCKTTGITIKFIRMWVSPVAHQPGFLEDMYCGCNNTLAQTGYSCVRHNYTGGIPAAVLRPLSHGLRRRHIITL